MDSDSDIIGLADDDLTESSVDGENTADYYEHGPESRDSSQYGICGCASLQSVRLVGPTHSDLLYDTLVHHELYEPDKDAEFQDSSSNLTEDTESAEKSIIPLNLAGVFGFNLNTKLINLSTNEIKEVFLVASHKGVIYNYQSKQMSFINAHNGTIVSAAIDCSGRWLATAHCGKDGNITISDTATCKSIHSVQYKPEATGSILLAMSPNGKYLVSLHKMKSKPIAINMWLWTYGVENPNDTYEYCGKKHLGEAKKICFHPNQQEHMMFAFKRSVFFTKWDDGKFSQPVFPKLKRNLGSITDCTLAQYCHECFASTSEGYLIVFGSRTYMEYFEEHPIDNNKSFIKAIRVSNFSIEVLEAIDGNLVCADSHGVIRYFDKRLTLLYWYYNDIIPTIKHISFNLSPRNFKFEDEFSLSNNFFTDANPENYLETLPEDRVDEYELLFRNSVPSEATLQRNPFIVRNFIASCINGNVYLIDIVNKHHFSFFSVSDSPITCVDCSDEKTHIVVGYRNRRVSLYDYEMFDLIVSNIIPDRNPNLPEEGCSYIKYSPQTIHLAVGTNNGELWFLNQLMKTTSPSPLYVTGNKIMKIVFAENVKYCAYFDCNRTVYLFKFNSRHWRNAGKIRSHHKTITDIMFEGLSKPRLFTISEDMHLVEYFIESQADIPEFELNIKVRQRIEQSATPQCFMWYPTEPGEDLIILYSDNQQKYKMLDEKSKIIRSISLGPAHGCYDNSYLNEIRLLPNNKGKYIVFANNRHLGIQKLPADGNPYKYLGVVANSNLSHFAISKDGDYIFTCGQDDPSLLVWKVNVGAVDLLHRKGGYELAPYYCLIEGGDNGWFFKEMKDLFCYMQIVHQGDSYQPQKFCDRMSLANLPDILRACGYYPSEFDIRNIMNDIKYREHSPGRNFKDDITFIEFVKLYINHRPPHGITADELSNHYELLFARLDYYYSGFVEKDEFVETLCGYGEEFTLESLNKCLATLFRRKSNNLKSECSNFYLPEEIDFNIFSNDILGILRESVYEETQKGEVD